MEHSRRVVSPENVLNTGGVFETSPNKAPLNQHASAYTNAYYGEPEQRVTIWNKVEGRKLSGNSAPFRKNLGEYIRKHPEWELYAGQDKEGYVPGQNLCPPPPQRPSSSRTSPRGEAPVPRERESRRVAVQAQRRAQQELDSYNNSPRMHSSGLRSPRDSGYGQAMHGDGLVPLGAAPGLTYRHAIGRENEAPLKLDDVALPSIVPSAEETKKRRNAEVAAKMAAVLAEGAASEEGAPLPMESEQVWDREWALATSKVMEEKQTKEAQLKEAKIAAELKRKAEWEVMQAKSIETSVTRIITRKRARNNVKVEEAV